MSGNTFPAPNGVTASVSDLINGVAGPNMVWGELGRYAITWEATNAALNDGVKLVLQQVIAGVTSAYLTMKVPGRYDIALPTGGGTFNFLATSIGGGVGVGPHVVRRASMTQVDPTQRT